MKKSKINNKGITLIVLALAVTILIIISTILIYNARNGVKMRTLIRMRNDIELLDNKVDEYYVKYGALPGEILYPKSKLVFNKEPNDNDKYYVIDLKALDGIRLNYGSDYSKITTGMTDAQIGQYTDVYVVNEQSHHIYYVKGVNIDGIMYYTNDTDERVSLEAVPQLSYKDITEKTVKLILNIANGSNVTYNYKIYVNGTVIKEETSTSGNLIETDEYRTIFDTGIQDAYAVIEYEGKTIETNHIGLEDLKISDKNEMEIFRNNVNNGKSYEGKTIRQIENVDLQGSSSSKWTPIGTESTPFSGIYDGEKHTILNLYIDTTSEMQGLFGYNKGTIKNIGIESGEIKNAGQRTGAILGYNKEGTIEGCYNKINVNAVADCGGICGRNDGGTIRRCYNAGNITGTQTAESPYHATMGIAGVGKLIEECYNTGNITHISSSLNGRACGISEENSPYNGSVISCYNTGTIKIIQTGQGNNCAVAAGIIGQATGSMTIKNCYNVGQTIVDVEDDLEIRQAGILGCKHDLNIEGYENVQLVNNYYLNGTAPYEVRTIWS